ncbi:MAG: hypothetical protein IIY89_00360, partial [Clostridia bacterium]|nr:hypothetical protein [Clostridia bacterium]
MLWLYFCMFIMLVGAEINVAWESTYRRIAARYYRRTRRKIAHLSEERDKVIKNMTSHVGLGKKKKSQ